MSPEDRRRFGAVAALAGGLFVGLALVPVIPTGPLGRGLGNALWSGLGAGAVGLPLLGLGLGLAGFDHLPRLDMKRAAILLGGLTLLVPFTMGVLLNTGAAAFDPPLLDWGMPARLTGVLPGLLSRGVVQLIGQIGGIILGFVALTGLTLATLAWHPLQRLEKKPVTEEAARRAAAAGIGAEPDGWTGEAEQEDEVAVQPPAPRR